MLAKILVDNNTRNEWKAEWGLAVYIEYNGHKMGSWSLKKVLV